MKNITLSNVKKSIENLLKEHTELDEYKVETSLHDEYIPYHEYKDNKAECIIRRRKIEELKQDAIKELAVENKIIRNNSSIRINDMKLGMGASKRLYTDVKSFTIVEISKNQKTIIIQEDEASLVPEWKPHFISGGFAGHCTNNHEQKWLITSNPNGVKITFTKRKNGRYYAKGSTMTNDSALNIGHHRYFHDYNF